MFSVPTHTLALASLLLASGCNSRLGHNEVVTEHDIYLAFNFCIDQLLSETDLTYELTQIGYEAVPEQSGFYVLDKDPSYKPSFMHSGAVEITVAPSVCGVRYFVDAGFNAGGLFKGPIVDEKYQMTTNKLVSLRVGHQLAARVGYEKITTHIIKAEPPLSPSLDRTVKTYHFGEDQKIELAYEQLMVASQNMINQIVLMKTE